MQPQSRLSPDHHRVPLQVEQVAPGVGMCGVSRRQLTGRCRRGSPVRAGRSYRPLVHDAEAALVQRHVGERLFRFGFGLVGQAVNAVTPGDVAQDSSLDELLAHAVGARGLQTDT